MFVTVNLAGCVSKNTPGHTPSIPQPLYTTPPSIQHPFLYHTPLYHSHLYTTHPSIARVHSRYHSIPLYHTPESIPPLSIPYYPLGIHPPVRHPLSYHTLFIPHPLYTTVTVIPHIPLYQMGLQSTSGARFAFYWNASLLFLLLNHLP